MIEVVDAHHHLWKLGTAGQRYPWLEDAPVDRFHGPDAALRVDYPVDGFLGDAAQLESLGMRLVGSVHVDAGAVDGVAEARWIAATRDTRPVAQAIVAGADLRAPDLAAQLDALGDVPGFRGVRHILNWHPDPRYTYTASPDIIVDPAWRAGFAELARRGLSFDTQVYPGQYPDVAELAREYPSTTFVLNHTGMPIGRRATEIAAWRSDLARLSELPNVAIKISGLGMVDHRWTDASIEPFVVAAIEAFGVDRSMFASNFPVDALYSTYGELYAAFDRLTRSASAHERAALFGATARRIYRMDLDGSPRQETNR